MGEKTTRDTLSSLLSYKGSVSGLKGLLTEGLATVVSSIDRITDSGESITGPVERIPLEQIYPNPDQPRQVFEPRALEELSVTMKELGQAQAITVRKTDSGFEIIAGERRYRAAKLAGLTHLDCVIKDVEPREANLLSLVENIQRQDLLPIEEALFLRKILDENPELSLDKLAKLLGSHKSTLSEKIQLTEVPEELKPLLFGKGKHFTHRHWRVISRINDGAFLKEMMSKAIEHQLSVVELERALEAAGISKAERKNKKKASDGNLSLLSDEELRNLSLVRKDGGAYKIKSANFNVAQMPSDTRTRLIAELEDLLQSLRQPEAITP